MPIEGHVTYSSPCVLQSLEKPLFQPGVVVQLGAVVQPVCL